MPNALYLIKEGECKLVSSAMPLQFHGTPAQLVNKPKGKQFVKDIWQNKSYFSKTTNSFQIGLSRENEFVG